MVAPSHPKRLAYFDESTQGTPPANAAAWASSGQPIRFINGSLGMDWAVQSMIQDERNQDDAVLDYDPDIYGITGDVEFPFETYHHGGEDTAVPDSESQAQSTYMSMWEHAFGGLRQGTTHTLAGGGHTATVVNFDAVTSTTVGDWVGFVDSNGDVHHRQITDISTLAVTLHRALPFTPSDSDLAIGLTVAYVLESRLVDASSGPYTRSWLLEYGLAGATRSIEARGCVTYPTGITIERNAPPKVAWNTLVGSHIQADSAPTPDWSAVTTDGQPGLAIGPNTKVWFEDYLTTTNTLVHCASVSIDPGVVRQRLPTLTEVEDNMQALCTYGLARNPCMIEMQVLPTADGYLTDFQDARTYKGLQVERLAALGSSWSLYFPRCEITPNPVESEVEVARAQTIKMRAHRQGLGNNTYEDARMCVVFG